MELQFIKTESGERLVVLPEAEYRVLVEAAEDAADSEAVRRFRSALKAGDEELLPSELVKRILGGENPTRVWREHRGLTTKSLAQKAGLAAAYLSQIESGAREGSVETLRNIARALNVTIDDLVG